MTKIIAVPSVDRLGLNAKISSHFGHCEFYTLITIDEKNNITETNVISNVSHEQGGCIAPVQHLKNNNVNILLTEGMGARPFMYLSDIDIDVYHSGKSIFVKDAVEFFKNGKLEKFTAEYTCGGGGCH